MESLDDILRAEDAKKVRADAELASRTETARTKLQELADSYTSSVKEAFENMPEFKEPAFTSGGVSRDSSQRVTIRCDSASELLVLHLEVNLAWRTDAGSTLGVGMVGPLRGRVARRASPENGSEFQYRFANSIVVTPHCSVDAPTLRAKIAAAVQTL